MTKPQLYRDVIDRLVDECRHGQGAIGPDRVRAGVWNRNAPEDIPEHQRHVNLLLKELSGSQRETLAILLREAFEGGVFNTLKTLEAFEIAPFEDGYEGSPYHDFIGRLDEPEWEWPS